MKTFKVLYPIITALAFIALFHVSVPAAAANAAQQLPGSVTQAVKSVTKNIDPCVFGTEAQLKSLLNAGLGGYFPIKHSKDGDHVTISKPQLTSLTCPNLRLGMRADIRYQKTRGIPQFSSSGKVRFTSPLIARVTYSFGSPPVVHKALACLTNINITELDLNNVPNWLDNTWVRQWLNGKLANRMCFDVTSLVRVYVLQGGTL